MAETKEKTQKFKVKSHITMGVRNPDQEDPTAPDYIVMKSFAPGSSIELTKVQAEGARHALENPPPMSRAAMVGLVTDEESELDEELDEDEEEALDSIRRRPDNPQSGVQLHWKTDRVAVNAENSRRRSSSTAGTRLTGGGFERENAGDTAGVYSLTGGGINDPGTALGPRPESNKTEMEREEEETIRKAQEKEQKELQKKQEAANKK